MASAECPCFVKLGELIERRTRSELLGGVVRESPAIFQKRPGFTQPVLRNVKSSKGIQRLGHVGMGGTALSLGSRYCSLGEGK